MTAHYRVIRRARTRLLHVYLAALFGGADLRSVLRVCEALNLIESEPMALVGTFPYRECDNSATQSESASTTPCL